MAQPRTKNHGNDNHRADDHATDNHAGEESPQISRQGIAPSPHLVISRELTQFLKGTLDGESDPSVALSARSISQIFQDVLPDRALTLDEARGFHGIQCGRYFAWPIFVTPGYRGSLSAVVNRREVEQAFRHYFPTDPSTIRGAIGEAVRNIGQHGTPPHIRLTDLREGEAVFASAGLFVREVLLGSHNGSSIRTLVAAVVDEGRGIGDAERSMIDGVGCGNGEACEGLAIELRGSLVYLIKEANGRWSLFDGFNAVVPSKYIPDTLFRSRAIAPDERVARVCEVDLPAPSRGCQKIMFFAPPEATEDARARLSALLLEALAVRPLGGH